MSSTDQSPQRRGPRGRGSIRRYRSGYQVRVPAGTDPATGERITLHGTAPTLREAERLRTKLLSDADNYRAARSKATLGYLLDRWFARHDVEFTTRRTYEGLIRNHIRPALGDVSLTTLVRRSTDLLEGFYADLRRCRSRCTGRPLVEHRVTGPHDCVAAGCLPHQCRPLSPSCVRQIHAILSSACTAAVRWGWIPFNPTEAARRPAQPRPNPRPPHPSTGRTDHRASHRGKRRMGPVHMAGYRHRRAPGRALRPPLDQHRPGSGHRHHRHELRRWEFERHQDPPEAPRVRR